VFIGYSNGLTPLKKRRGKGSKGNKRAVTPKKKSLITADDNIIPKPDVSFELGKSISRREAEIAKEATRVHETHERLVTEKPTSKEVSNESDGELANRPTGSRRPSGFVFRDISRVSKKKSLDQSQKLKATPRDSSKGACITPEVHDESKCIITTSSEGTGIIPGVPYEVKGSYTAKSNAAIDWGSEEESVWSDEAQVNKEEIEWVSIDKEEEQQDDQDDDDDRSINIEETDDDEKIDDEYLHDDEYVHNDADEEMKDAEDVKTGKDDDEITDAANTDAEKT
ncbi:hypothetical protein Tco_0185588, partial [Tanacetum coccineum]